MRMTMKYHSLFIFASQNNQSAYLEFSSCYPIRL